ncbi:MazG nucleotide pyrophosphohydrolase domain-containing protein [Streptantibioticus silvisoli]|uniref:MazG nucleotide pyrophosphohydrolase domain-containing protein n=1 Tax=Streptantibioticus silvisoli TaxID=2705255 RepID=A0ABT6W718_9ACTN|nr:MazG nucleotide pyrophosphohydrolase domain-containing protein [Streptantibioticus silvisoli]MDI5965777.1 MazG nucleotide pyrophosphohydrolase domain-containing protein [Streptantibioticus silvisoli]
MPDLSIRATQSATWANKQAKSFNTTDVPLEFGLLYGEVAEAFDAWRKGLPGLGEELADVYLYLVSLAEMTGIDLADAVEQKMAVNSTRVYRRIETGALIKDTP